MATSSGTTSARHSRSSKDWHCLLLASSVLLWSRCGSAEDFEDPRERKLGTDDRDTVESTCRLESFYVVDANTMAKRAKVPLCDPDKMFRVATHSGQIFLRDTEESERHKADAMHFFGTYAAPWFLYQGIADSPYQTRDKSRAGLFYVNDYCYYMWWLAVAESQDTSIESPGAYLLKIYEEILKTPMWEQREGRNFVFFIPWSLAHVLAYENSRPDGGVISAYVEMVCDSLLPALQITVENFQGRNMCKHDKDKKTLVAPFVPNVIDIRGQALVESLSHMQRHLHGLDNRTTLVYFKGRCVHHTQSPSRLLRSHVAAALADAGDDFHVKCVEEEPTGRLPFERLLTEMEKSVFCLVLPETGQSARLLSEVMLAGCIPVFLGPPFAAMPFENDLDYRAFSVVIHLKEHKWVHEADSKIKGAGGMGAAEEALSTAKGVSVDADLESVEDLARFLRSVPRDAKIEGLLEVQKARRSFIFYPELDLENPSAVDLLTLNLCRHMNQIANSLPTTDGMLRRFLRAVGAGTEHWFAKMDARSADSLRL